MTSGSVKSTSAASRAEMMAELHDMDDDQILGILEAHRNHQDATNEGITEQAAESSTTTNESTTRKNKTYAGNFAKAYAQHGLAAEHAKCSNHLRKSPMNHQQSNSSQST